MKMISQDVHFKEHRLVSKWKEEELIRCLAWVQTWC